DRVRVLEVLPRVDALERLGAVSGGGPLAALGAGDLAAVLPQELQADVEVLAGQVQRREVGCRVRGGERVEGGGQLFPGAGRLGDAGLGPQRLVVDHGAVACEAGDRVERAVDGGRVLETAEPGVALLQVFLVVGDVEQCAVGRVAGDLGVADVDDVRRGRGAQSGAQLRGDALPLLHLHVGLCAGALGELLLDGLERGLAVVVLHDPDGEGAALAVDRLGDAVGEVASGGSGVTGGTAAGEGDRGSARRHDCGRSHERAHVKLLCLGVPPGRAARRINKESHFIYCRTSAALQHFHLGRARGRVSQNLRVFRRRTRLYCDSPARRVPLLARTGPPHAHLL